MKYALRYDPETIHKHQSPAYDHELNLWSFDPKIYWGHPWLRGTLVSFMKKDEIHTSLPETIFQHKSPMTLTFDPKISREHPWLMARKCMMFNPISTFHIRDLWSLNQLLTPTYQDTAHPIVLHQLKGLSFATWLTKVVARWSLKNPFKYFNQSLIYRSY